MSTTQQLISYKPVSTAPIKSAPFLLTRPVDQPIPAAQKAIQALPAEQEILALQARKTFLEEQRPFLVGNRYFPPGVVSEILADPSLTSPQSLSWTNQEVINAIFAIGNGIMSRDGAKIINRLNFIWAQSDYLKTIYPAGAVNEILSDCLADPSFTSLKSLSLTNDQVMRRIFVIGNQKMYNYLAENILADHLCDAVSLPSFMASVLAEIDKDLTPKAILSGKKPISEEAWKKVKQISRNRAKDFNNTKLELEKAFGKDILDPIWAKLPSSEVSLKKLSDATMKKLIADCSLELMKCKKPIKEDRIKELHQFYTKHAALLDPTAKRLADFISKLHNVLTAGSLTRVRGSTSGVYFGESDNKTEVVIKPKLEEAYTPYCPTICPFTMRSMRAEVGSRIVRTGSPSGEASNKEQMAFLSDFHNGNFAEIPFTLLLEINHRPPMVKEGDSGTKVCSVQEYIPDTVPLALYSHSDDIDKRELEKIAFLDIISGNSDRHLANILVTKDGKLVPIDHGYTRSDSKGIQEYRFNWTIFKQLKGEISKETKAQIAAFNVQSHLNLLREQGQSEESIQLEYARIILMKKAAEANLSFFDMAEMMVHNFKTNASFLPSYCKFGTMYKNAKNAEKNGISFEKAWEAEVNYAMNAMNAWRTS